VSAEVRVQAWERQPVEGKKGKSPAPVILASLALKVVRCPSRRLPKRGFTNIFKKRWLEISLNALEKHFDKNEEVNPELLHARGLIKKAKHDVVVLGNGELSKPLRVSAHRFYQKRAPRRLKKRAVRL